MKENKTNLIVLRVTKNEHAEIKENANGNMTQYLLGLHRKEKNNRKIQANKEPNTNKE